MNICFYINTLSGTGGTERLTVMLANELSSNPSFTISIISRQGGGESFFL